MLKQTYTFILFTLKMSENKIAAELKIPGITGEVIRNPKHKNYSNIIIFETEPVKLS